MRRSRRSRGWRGSGLRLVGGLLAAWAAPACDRLLWLEEAHCGEGLAGCGSADASAGESPGDGGGGGMGAGPSVDDGGGADPPVDAGTDGGPPADGGAGAPVDVEAQCSRYCTEIQATCTGEFQPYEDVPECRATCKRWDPGVPGDTNVNTRECRLGQLRSAVNVGGTSEIRSHCPQAGPTGEPSEGEILSCGSSCEAYCQVLERACVSQFEEYMGSNANCLNVCAELDFDPALYSSRSDEGDRNTVQCRTWHLALAARLLDDGDESGNTTHCGHAVGVARCEQRADAGL